NEATSVGQCPCRARVSPDMMVSFSGRETQRLPDVDEHFSVAQDDRKGFHALAFALSGLEIELAGMQRTDHASVADEALRKRAAFVRALRLRREDATVSRVKHRDGVGADAEGAPFSLRNERDGPEAVAAHR